MPKITIPYSFQNGEGAPAEHFSDNLYFPVETGSSDTPSMDVINGQLDYQNLNEPAAFTDWRKTGADSALKPQLSRNAIRQGSLSRGRMVGSTENAHYLDQIWAETVAVQRLPGAGISFFAPTGGKAIITWQVSVGSDAIRKYDSSTSSVVQENVLLYLMKKDPDSDPASNAMQQLLEIHCRLPTPRGRQTGSPPSGSGVSFSEITLPNRDRIWSGHYYDSNVLKGWNSFAIGMYSGAANTRVRVRNMKYLWLL